MISILIAILCCSLPSVIARDIQFIPYLGNEPVTLGQHIPVGQDTLTITSLKFYISTIHSSSEYTSPTIISLLDMDHSLSCSIPNDASTLRFGLDSATNVATTFSHSLDPIHGMFWTWNSGYVNCKIEGTSLRSKQLHNAVTIHLGGFRYPNATSFTLNIPKYENIIIAIDLLPVLQQVIGVHAGNIMSAGEVAFECSRILMNSVRIQQ